MGMFVLCFMISATIISLRNIIVYRIRISILNSDYDMYKRLPSYHCMMLSPTHLYLWTTWQYKRKYKING